jgi:hypothetical protein
LPAIRRAATGSTGSVGRMRDVVPRPRWPFEWDDLTVDLHWVAPPRPTRDHTALNGAAVAALVVAVLCPPAGLGLARSARRQCLARGRRGAGLALVAHVVAAAGTGLLGLLGLLAGAALLLR